MLYYSYEKLENYILGIGNVIVAFLKFLPDLVWAPSILYPSVVCA